MNHEEWQVLVSAYHDGEVTADERAQVEAHLAECAECAELLANCRHWGQAIHSLPRGEPSRELWPRVQGKLPTRRPSVWRRLLPVASVATMLLFAITAVASLRLAQVGMAPTALQPKEAAELQSAPAPAATMMVMASPASVPPVAQGETMRVDANDTGGAPLPCPGVPLSMEVVSLAVARDAGMAGPQVRGVLYDAGGRPVAGATLVVSGTAEWQGSATTAADGTFAMDLPAAGTYRLVLGLSADEVLYASAEEDTTLRGFMLLGGAVCSVPAEMDLAPVTLAANEVAIITLRLK